MNFIKKAKKTLKTKILRYLVIILLFVYKIFGAYFNGGNTVIYQFLLQGRQIRVLDAICRLFDKSELRET